jgi:hypothetical protein
LFQAFLISKNAVCASINEQENALNIFKLLLKSKFNFELEISENLLMQALYNKFKAFELISILVDQ